MQSISQNYQVENVDGFSLRTKKNHQFALGEHIEEACKQKLFSSALLSHLKATPRKLVDNFSLRHCSARFLSRLGITCFLKKKKARRKKGSVIAMTRMK